MKRSNATRDRQKAARAAAKARRAANREAHPEQHGYATPRERMRVKADPFFHASMYHGQHSVLTQGARLRSLFNTELALSQMAEATQALAAMRPIKAYPNTRQRRGR